LPEPLCYQGELYPERVKEVLRARLEDEKAGLRSLLVRYKKELESEQPAPERQEASAADETPFSARKKENAEQPGNFEMEILFHDKPVSPPEDIKRLVTSVLLDLGELPPEYLAPAGDGDYKPKGTEEEDEDASADVWSGTYHERGAHLSDGKPDDYSDEYRSEYGIEDTRRALIEAKRSGIHPFCITIDKEGQDYRPHMYGAASCTMVDAVEKLPYKVSEIYWQLTV
jgi:hypothetical protein